MSGFELAKRRLGAGYKLRFYQDYYGRQWVKINGGWMFWRNARVYLRNEEMLDLKRAMAERRGSRSGVAMDARSVDAT